MRPDSSYRLHALIDGRVQGVGFRQYVLYQAIALDLTGWVRNRFDGKVEVIAEGPRQDLDQLLDYLKEGPRMSHVSGIDLEWGSCTGEFSSFDIEATF